MFVDFLFVGIVEFIMYRCIRYFRERYQAAAVLLNDPRVVFCNMVTKYMKEKIEKAHYHRRILVTCSRRLENPAGLRLSPSLSVFFSGIVEMQMRGGGPANPYIREGEPAARQPGGRSQEPVCNYFLCFFCGKAPAAGRPGPGRPAAGRPGYISVNFHIENIFL